MEGKFSVDARLRSAFPLPVWEKLQFRDQSSQTLRAFRFTFPDNEDAPLGCYQEGVDLKIALSITSEFGCPPFDPSFWCTVTRAVFMTMPETAMNEHHGASVDQY